MAHVSSACDTGAAERTSFEIAGLGRECLGLPTTLLRAVSMKCDVASAVSARAGAGRGVCRSR